MTYSPTPPPFGLASPREWGTLTADQRRTYLAALTPRGRRLLAELLAAGVGQPSDLIVRSWLYFGLIGAIDAGETLNAEIEAGALEAIQAHAAAERA